MPIQTTCPICDRALRLSDAVRGKQVRCPGCRGVFTLGGGATAAGPSAVSTGKHPARRAKDDEDAAPAPVPRKASWLPIVAAVAGLLFLLCAGGGAAVVYVLCAGFMAAADQTKHRAAEMVDQAVKDAKRSAVPPPDDGNEPAKAPDAPKPPDGPNAPADKPKAPDADAPKPAPVRPKAPGAHAPKPAERPKPFEKPKAPEAPAAVAPVAASLSLDCAPFDLDAILFAAPEANLAVAVVRRGAGLAPGKMRFDRYDLAAGRKLDAAEISAEGVATAFDLSPDGELCLFSTGNSAYTVVRLADGKPVMHQWTVPPPPPGGKPAEGIVIAAYLIDGKRLLTVNGAGGASLWSIPEGKRLHSWAPPARDIGSRFGLFLHNATAVSRDRKKLAVFNGEDGFLILDLPALKLQGVVRSPEDAKAVPDSNFMICGATFSPDDAQLAAMFRWEKPGVLKGAPANVVRWDLQHLKTTARFADPTDIGSLPGSGLTWWGSDWCWVYPTAGHGTAALFSWDSQAVVVQTADKLADRCWPYPAGADGRQWFVASRGLKQGDLKAVDLPADALRQAARDGQVLMLTADGAVKK